MLNALSHANRVHEFSQSMIPIFSIYRKKTVREWRGESLRGWPGPQSDKYVFVSNIFYHDATDTHTCRLGSSIDNLPVAVEVCSQCPNILKISPLIARSWEPKWDSGDFAHAIIDPSVLDSNFDKVLCSLTTSTTGWCFLQNLKKKTWLNQKPLQR